jgi:predicted acylesterase/phospholipase RssA
VSGEVIVAILSFAGTVIGSIVGIVTANRLTAYRLEQLEKSVEKLSGVFERVALVERDVKNLSRRFEEAEAKL